MIEKSKDQCQGQQKKNILWKNLERKLKIYGFSKFNGNFLVSR